MIRRSTLLLAFLLTPLASQCQTKAVTLPAGTPLPVQIDDHLPMRVGQPIRAELIYPVYADNEIVLPEKTIVEGTVTALRPDHSHRISSRLRGDFTPFRIPAVHFTGILLADGSTLPITTSTATDGAPIYRLVAPPPRKGGFLHHQFDNGIQILRDQLAFFTAPDKRDRFTQLLYTQLPYHPQRIEKGTAWTVETTAPLSIPQQPVSAPVPAAKPADPSIWIINAYLGDKVSSATSRVRPGHTRHRRRTDLQRRPHHRRSGGLNAGRRRHPGKPARRFGRAGALHFDFRQLVLPSGKTQNVQAALTGADSARTRPRHELRRPGKTEAAGQDRRSPAADRACSQPAASGP